MVKINLIKLNIKINFHVSNNYLRKRKRFVQIYRILYDKTGLFKLKVNVRIFDQTIIHKPLFQNESLKLI